MTGAVPADDVGFVAEGGSVVAILRAIQLTLILDGAGPLPLAAHSGSAVRPGTAA